MVSFLFVSFWISSFVFSVSFVLCTSNLIRFSLSMKRRFLISRCCASNGFLTMEVILEAISAWSNNSDFFLVFGSTRYHFLPDGLLYSYQNLSPKFIQLGLTSVEKINLLSLLGENLEANW